MRGLERGNFRAKAQQHLADIGGHAWVFVPFGAGLGFCHNYAARKVRGHRAQAGHEQDGLILQPSGLTDDHDVERLLLCLFWRHFIRPYRFVAAR